MEYPPGHMPRDVNDGHVRPLVQGLNAPVRNCPHRSIRGCARGAFHAKTSSGGFCPPFSLRAARRYDNLRLLRATRPTKSDMDDLLTIFDKLMMRTSLDGIETKRQFEWIGTLIDLSGDLGREDGNVRALEWCDELEKSRLTDRQKSLLEYFRANTWANRQRGAYRGGEDAVWQWVQPELEHQVYHLRSASRAAGFDKLAVLRRCQIRQILRTSSATSGASSMRLLIGTVPSSFSPALVSRLATEETG